MSGHTTGAPRAMAGPGITVGGANLATDEGREALRVWLRLLSCTNLIERRLRDGLRRKFDSTLPRFDALAQLQQADAEGRAGLTMSALSRRLMVTNGNITGLVARLEREGLVRRATAAADRRAQLVRLTPAGRRALAAMMPDHGRWVTAMFAGLSREERAALHGLIGKLKDAASSASGEDTE